MSKWLQEDIDFLKSSLKDGKHYEYIAKSLNKTWGSVRNKANSLGLKYNDFNDYNKTIVCLYCNTENIVKRYEEKKFCNSSCAASYNCSGRVLSDDTKIKISIGLNGKGELKIVYDENCVICGSINKTKYQRCCSPECHQDFLRLEKIKNGKLGDQAIKRYLIKLHGAKCMECGWDKVNPYSNKPAIQLEHIDGNSKNNSLDNLKLLCPNCHSLTPTFGALNKGNGTRIYIQRK